MLVLLPENQKQAQRIICIIESVHTLISALHNALPNDVDEGIKHAIECLDKGASVGGAICAGVKAARASIADHHQPKPAFKRRHKWPCVYKPNTHYTRKRGYCRTKLENIIL